MLYAVLTGDLIASRSAPPEAVDASMAALRRAAGALGARAGFDPRFTRNRGDGWQAVMPLPGPLLDLPLILVAGLNAAQTGLDTRIAIASGEVQSLGKADLSDAAGAAFVASGALLETLGGRAAPHMALDGPAVTDWMRAALAPADWIAQGWTAGQAEAVLRTLKAPEDTTARHAKALGISRQSFERRLRGSGLQALDAARTAFAAAAWSAP